MKRIKMLESAIANSKSAKDKEILQEKLNKSRKGKASRNKGASYENTIAKLFNEKYQVVLKRTPSSGGFSKAQKNEFFCGDLTCVDKDKKFNLHIECKNQKTIKIKEWIKQSMSDCVDGKTPVVIFHQNRKIEDRKVVEEAEDYIVMTLDAFCKLVPRENLVEVLK